MLPNKRRTTVHCCLHGEAARFLADLITPSAAATATAGLRSATSGSVAVSRVYYVITRWPLVRSGCSACLKQCAVTTSSSSSRWHFQPPTLNISLCSGFLAFPAFLFQSHLLRLWASALRSPWPFFDWLTDWLTPKVLSAQHPLNVLLPSRLLFICIVCLMLKREARLRTDVTSCLQIAKTSAALRVSYKM